MKSEEYLEGIRAEFRAVVASGDGRDIAAIYQRMTGAADALVALELVEPSWASAWGDSLAREVLVRHDWRAKEAVTLSSPGLPVEADLGAPNAVVAAVAQLGSVCVLSVELFERGLAVRWELRPPLEDTTQPAEHFFFARDLVLELSDELGTSYEPRGIWGVEFDTRSGAARGERRFVPAPPRGAQAINIRNRQGEISVPHP